MHVWAPLVETGTCYEARLLSSAARMRQGLKVPTSITRAAISECAPIMCCSCLVQQLSLLTAVARPQHVGLAAAVTPAASQAPAWAPLQTSVRNLPTAHGVAMTKDPRQANQTLDPITSMAWIYQHRIMPLPSTNLGLQRAAEVMVRLAKTYEHCSCLA